jgi:hypothetical protein
MVMSNRGIEVPGISLIKDCGCRYRVFRGKTPRAGYGADEE